MIDSTSDLYYIYGKSEANVYESLKTVYDEVQPPKPRLVHESPPHHDVCARPRPSRICATPVWLIVVLLFLFISLWIGYISITVRFYSNGSSTSGSETVPPTSSTPVEESCSQPPKYMTRPWYVVTEELDYMCDDWRDPVSYIIIERFTCECCTCTDRYSCQDYQQNYKAENSCNAKYSLYVGSDGVVFSGRNWTCPYRSGTLWVGLMVDCVAHTPPCDSILHHLTEVSAYAKKCGFIANNASTEYANTSTS